MSANRGELAKQTIGQEKLSEIWSLALEKNAENKFDRTKTSDKLKKKSGRNYKFLV